MSILLNSIYKSFEDTVVMENFTLQIRDEGISCLFGASGSGKTTILRLITGLLQPDAGKVYDVRDKLSVMFQEDRLLPWNTLLQNIELVSDQDTALHYLDAVGLAQDAQKLPDELSGGMRRRAALARALAFDGEWILLDEPFKGLDEELKQHIMQLVLAESQKRPVILITHDAYEIAYLADVVFCLSANPLRILRKLTLSVPAGLRTHEQIMRYTMWLRNDGEAYV
ncbi:MAG: ATP-binding cassette domain-containing protein [Christensenellales bacterium]|jgi:NitT/TauT family transport system ATP-binding protein